MAIPKCVLTKRGSRLLAKTPAGAQVPVTRWQMGTGALSAEKELEDMTQLVCPLIYRPISSVTNNGQQSLVLGQFVNEGMDAFVWEELGLWASDPEEGEILYAVGNARGNGEVIESWSEKLREFTFGMELVFSGAANVTAEISRTLVFATLKDLEQKADLVNGKVPEHQLPEMHLPNKADLVNGIVPVQQLPGNILYLIDGKIQGEYLPEDVLRLVDGKIPLEHLLSTGAWYRTFEAEQWSGGVLRIPRSVHGMTPVGKACMYQLRQRVERTALDYFGPSAALGRAAIVGAMKAALTANEAVPGTYPAAFDGHIELTWYQMQYYLLEGVLTTAQEAAAKAREKGFDWQEIDTTGAKEIIPLDNVLKLAYVPALDGSPALMDERCTDKVLQGLRLRRKEDRAGAVSVYDLDGYLSKSTWNVLESKVYWDLETQDLVIENDTPFAGGIFVNGSGGGGSYGSGAYTLPVATQDVLGGVKIGGGLSVAPDGTLSVDTADEADVTEMLAEAFAPDNK